MKSAFRAAIAAAPIMFAAACTSFVQTTSGESYLARADASGATLSDELRAAAAVEPIIEFPARIGIARIENGRLTDIPEPEWETIAAEFQKPELAKNEFAPVSLFVIDLAAPYDAAPAPLSDKAVQRRSVIDRLRLGGARQHLDAIIVYEVYGTADARNSAFSLADWTLIGAYIAPGRRASAVGHASALMFDVRNGYPYGGAAATVEKEKLSPLAYARGRSAELLKESQTAAVADLAPKLSTMISILENEMNAKKVGGGAR